MPTTRLHHVFWLRQRWLDDSALWQKSTEVFLSTTITITQVCQRYCNYLEVRSHGYKCSYASVMRGPRRQCAAAHTAHQSYQRSTRPEQYPRQISGDDSTHQVREDTITDVEWWHAPRRQRRADLTQQREDASALCLNNPDFGTKVRILYKIIKASYHLKNV